MAQIMMIINTLQKEKPRKSGGVSFLSLNKENKSYYKRTGLIHVK